MTETRILLSCGRCNWSFGLAFDTFPMLDLDRWRFVCRCESMLTPQALPSLDAPGDPGWDEVLG